MLIAFGVFVAFGGRFFWNLPAAPFFLHYFRGNATFGVLLLSEVYSTGSLFFIIFLFYGVLC